MKAFTSWHESHFYEANGKTNDHAYFSLVLERRSAYYMVNSTGFGTFHNTSIAHF